MTTMWISAEHNPPTEFNERGQSKKYLVYIDNPFFDNGNYWVSFCEKTPFGVMWRGIEPNVHHGNEQPNVVYYCELPPAPIV